MPAQPTAASVPRTACSRSLIDRYQAIRTLTEQLCRPLEIDDYQLQSMADCSPPKWHLAHTTWFFETFVLAPHVPDYSHYHPQYNFLFNSYYEAAGERWPRPWRGLLSRPTVAEVFAYRRAVDDQLSRLLERADQALLVEVGPRIELGLNHEQQHQELLLTDLKHALALNPLRPAYARPAHVQGHNGRASPVVVGAVRWQSQPGALHWIGHEGGGFAFDNELPRHQVYVHPFELASRLTTAGEFMRFMDDGGYQRPQLWLSDGWAARQTMDWNAPLYWHREGASWHVFSLHGPRPLDPSEPLCHVSYYEADAFARWAGVRLPTEAEWETQAHQRPLEGSFLESGRLHPALDGGGGGQFFGEVWQWTSSPYTAYPGYRPASGALGEYNAKFMCNQLVLRGGSCLTPRTHVRASYRNFFPAPARWQCSGVRLARDAQP